MALRFFRSAITVIVLLGATSVYAEEAQRALSDADLQTMGGDIYSNGVVPLGDQHYVTDAPRKGYIYLCRVPGGDGGGAQGTSPWIHTDTWSFFDKPTVSGEVYWSRASFTNRLSGEDRLLEGNGLPVDQPTGTFPIQQSDPVYRYDRNPSTISAQSVQEALPAHPVYSPQPFCMGMESGIMLTGVPLFNGFDAGLRDAAAHEVQDRCDGHPQQRGQYHYHSLSACMKDTNVKTVLGYALDGFPITGPMVGKGRYLTTKDLDECHGISSEIIQDGQKVVTYHYVMTRDFPYSVSCFRAQPVRTGPAQNPQGQQGQQMQQGLPQGPGGMMPQMQGMQPMQNMMGGGRPRTPPVEALSACEGMRDGAACSFVSPRGDAILGLCHTPPGQQVLACVPAVR